MTADEISKHLGISIRHCYTMLYKYCDQPTIENGKKQWPPEVMETIKANTVPSRIGKHWTHKRRERPTATPRQRLALQTLLYHYQKAKYIKDKPADWFDSLCKCIHDGTI